jgi:hypothetical protein
MQQRSALILMVLTLPVLLLAGCAETTYAILPAGSGVTRLAGLRLVAEGDAWKSEPHDLPNIMTPILADIENHTDKDIRISYADFSLTGDQGFRYTAVNPYTTATHVGLTEHEPAPASEHQHVLTAEAGATVTLAAHHGRRRPRARRVPPPHRRHHRRFFVRPRARAYFYHYDPWLYPFIVPPFYGDHVVVWPETTAPRPSEAVLRLGLPEGVVKPGGRISGFLYFQNAGQHTDHLRLSWAAHTPDGKKVATLDFPFNVIPR